MNARREPDCDQSNCTARQGSSRPPIATHTPRLRRVSKAGLSQRFQQYLRALYLLRTELAG